MPNVKLVQGRGQYQNQNAYRTINMAFVPYFPETQRYRMHLDSQFSGNRGGYFSVRPKPYAGPSESKLPWQIRMDSYDAKGTGRLSTLNTYSRKDKAVDSSQNLPLQAESSMLGQELTSLLSANNGRVGRQHDINNANELELAMLGREIENFLNVGVSQNISPSSQHREGALSTQTLDLYFNENLGIASAMESLTTPDEVNRSLGIEVTTSDNKRLGKLKEAAGSLNPALDYHLILGSKSIAETVFNNHAKKEINDLNKAIQSKLIGPAKREHGRSHVPLGASATDDQRLLETARSRFNMGAGGSMDSFARRLLSRHSEVLQDNIFSNMTKDSFMEQVPIGEHYQGIATIRGHVVNINGTRMPQFEIVNTHVVHGSTLSEAVRAQATRDIAKSQRRSFTLATSSIHVDAVNDAYRLTARENLLGTFQDASYQIDSIYGLSLYVGKAQGLKGSMGLTTPEIAEGLRIQISEMFNGKDVQQELSNFYAKMMERSNRLTEQWKSAVPTGEHGASIADEWTYGDLRGNPHKKYLGIWSARGQDTWRDGGDTGYNVSISPFLTTRREGTVRFK